MRGLTGTLEAAQESGVLEPRVKITFTDPAAIESDVVVEEGRIIQIPSQAESTDSQTCELILDNADGYFTGLNLEGWGAVLEWGLVASGDEYEAIAPLTVLSQYIPSAPGVLQCHLSLIGIPNRLAEDKASKDYFHHWSDEKKVKDMITEIANGEPVEVELTEEQADSDGYLDIDDTLHGVGQRLTISQTVTKIAFRLKKTGTPAGTDVTFKIVQVVAPQATLASQTFLIASIAGAPAWCEATLALTGTVTFNGGSTAITGAGTAFSTELKAGDFIKKSTGTQWYKVASVTNDNALVLTSNCAASDDGADAANVTEFSCSIDEEVWLYCEYPGGTATDYVSVSYNSVAIKPSENLTKIDPFDAAVEYSDLDCAYRYKYTGAGIDCWERDTSPQTYCQSYTVDYDSEDALISAYMPKDAFKILEGQSRLDKINQLLGYTTCVKIIKADGHIHVFVAKSSVPYDSDYSLAAGHTFFSKAVRKALVIPNRIVVRSLKTDATPYKGEAKDTGEESYGLLPISVYIRTKLVDNDQGNDIAAAMIAQLEMAAQRGAASVPMNLGTEVYDYVRVTDSRANDSRIGNIGYLKRSYDSRTQDAKDAFRMDFSFGRVPRKGVPGARPSLLRGEAVLEPKPVDEKITWGFVNTEIMPLFKIIADNFDDVWGAEAGESIEAIGEDLSISGLWQKIIDIFRRLGWLEDQEPTDEQIGDALLPYFTKAQVAALGYLKNLIEDTTPQLGGNLDCNAKKVTNMIRLAAPVGTDMYD